ncbi:MAG: hypothetical protein KA419_12900 [Acidobacteria bacterium]|nr:hypothetical protein [Acidobacteriota bacterium]
MPPRKTSEKPEVSLSSTKQQLLEAYAEMKAQLEDKARTELRPEKIAEEKHRREVTEAADTLAEEGVVPQITRLKGDIGRMLAELSENLEEATGKYLKLKESIAIKTRDLEEVFGIEKSAHSLAALVEAQQRRKAEFEAEMAALKEALECESGEARAAWEKEAAAHAEALKERDAQEKKDRQRRQEEFEYGFKRQQEQAQNALADQKLKLEKEIAALREEFQRTSAEKEKELKGREALVLEKESRLAELEKKVETFPKELDAQVGRAVKDAVQRVREDAEKAEALLKAESEGEKNVLKARIAALEAVAADQNARISALTAQMDGAYQKVQDIAVKAVEGSANRQVIAGLERKIEAVATRPAGEKNG